MHTTRLLRRAICDNPRERDLRLRYQDAVEEAGDPEYARFIRLQLAGEPYGKRPSNHVLVAILGGDEVFNAVRLFGHHASASVYKQPNSLAINFRHGHHFGVRDGLPFHWLCPLFEFEKLAGVVCDVNPITHFLATKWGAGYTGAGSDSPAGHYVERYEGRRDQIYQQGRGNVPAGVYDRMTGPEYRRPGAAPRKIYSGLGDLDRALYGAMASRAAELVTEYRAKRGDA